MKNKPQKRLGRGLENLINGGLQKPQPPSIHIDRTRIEPSDTLNSSMTPRPSAENPKEKLVNELNDALKKTQEEANIESDFIKNPKEEFPEDFLAEEKMSEELKSEAPKIQKPNFPKISSAPQNEVNSAVNSATGVFMLLPITIIKLSPYQRRKEFAPDAIKELANSIRSEGLMQPIVVRTLPEGGYELIAGERRLRACQSIGMEVIPVRTVNVPDGSAAVMGLIENLQRVDLNPVEEARGYGMLLTDFHLSQEQIAERVGKDRSTIANSLRLLLLEVEILGYIAKGQISVGHAKVLLGLPEGAERVMLARKVIEESLSVRQTEAQIRLAGKPGNFQKSKRVANETEIAVVKELEQKLVGRLNTKVNFTHSVKGGKMVIFYKSNAELEAILKKMGV